MSQASAESRLFKRQPLEMLLEFSEVKRLAWNFRPNVCYNGAAPVPPFAFYATRSKRDGPVVLANNGAILF